MDKVTFLDLSTRVVHDLKRWCEETTARNAITPEDLTILQGAAEIVDRITSTVVATSPE